MSIGEKIKMYRKSKRLTQEQLGELSGLSKNAIYNYENNKRTPNLNTICKISVALGIEVNDLIGSSNLKNVEDKKLEEILIDSYSSTGYLPNKKIELLSEIAFIASHENNPLENYIYLLGWLDSDKQIDIMNFLITAFKVKFAEIYSGDYKKDIEIAIKEIKDMSEGNLIYPPSYNNKNKDISNIEKENSYNNSDISEVVYNSTLKDLENAGFSKQTIERFKNRKDVFLKNNNTINKK